ncbi:hypothetical protein [Dyella sp. C11]|uniref:hypothetical protein n=1 Tax=Dyella sp. C11 TaxID=2126991 RepID=UPI0013001B9A|nr:hypothetical protein [Dyella sp. C11]
MQRHAGKMMLVGALLLQGCAGSATHRPNVPLFAADGTARFHAYLACTSHTANCADAVKSFQAWADDRRATLRITSPGDALFKQGTPSPSAEQDVPYRLVITYRPDIADSVSSTYANSAGNTYQPLVGYSASFVVYDAQTGAPLSAPRQLRDQVILRRGWGHIDGTLAAYVDDVIRHIDPAYGVETAATP